MRRALDLAKKGLGKTSLNPCVGAVIRRGHVVLGEGWHRKTGGPHAEVLAVQDAIKKGFEHKLQGATLYVTLEPCSTYGRTPPCVDLILKHRFKRVVVAATDPNPKHAGRAFKLLSKNGVEVVNGVLEDEAKFLNRSFNHWIVQQKPWVVAKVAMTLDGYMTRPKSQGQWITGEAARKDVHRERALCDAILVGAETVRQDNPRLTVRRGGKEVKRQPWRVVVTKKSNLDLYLKRKHLFSDDWQHKTLVYQGKQWRSVMKDLGSRGVTRLMVEGGGNVLDQLARMGWIHEVLLYYAPIVLDRGKKKALSGLVRADILRQLPLKNMQLKHVGDDLKLWGLV